MPSSTYAIKKAASKKTRGLFDFILGAHKSNKARRMLDLASLAIMVGDTGLEPVASWV